jgi:hypothetical protein
MPSFIVGRPYAIQKANDLPIFEAWLASYVSFWRIPEDLDPTPLGPVFGLVRPYGATFDHTPWRYGPGTMV